MEQTHRILIAFPPNSMIAKGMATDCYHTLCAHHYECRLLDYSSYKLDISQITAEMIAECVESFWPTVFLTFNDFGLFDNILKRYPLHFVSWFLDDPYYYTAQYRRAHKECPTYYACVFDPYYVSQLHEEGYKRVSTVRLATSWERLSQVRCTPAERERYSYDVAFVGNCTGKRIRVIESLAPEVRVGMWGYPAWARYARKNRDFNGMLDYEQETPKVYNSARIVLNITDLPVRSTANNRVFDVPAAGGFILTDAMDDMPHLFEEDEIAVYHNSVEMNDLIRYYVHHNDERVHMIERARRRVQECHTYYHRMQEIFSMIARNTEMGMCDTQSTLYADPDFRTVLFLLKNKRVSEAVKLWCSFFERSAEKRAACLALGERCMQLSYYEEARGIYEKGLSCFTHDLEIMHFLGIAYHCVRDYAKAEDLFRDILSSDPGRQDSRVQLAYVFIAQKRITEALAEVETVLRSSPDFTAALFIQFQIALRQNKITEALSVGHKIINLDRAYAQLVKNELAKLKSGEW